MRSLHYAAILATLLLAGCPPSRSAVQCAENGHCDLDLGGVCTLVDTGNRWCAYPDTDCPSGYRYSDFDVGDGVSGICVPEAARRTLTVQLGGKGAGSISTEPAGLTCSEDTCTGQFLVGATVKLSAAATTGSFLGWIDGCRGTDACEVAMDSDRAVGALFGNPGEALWAKQLGSMGLDDGSSIALDSDGDLIAVGSFVQTITPAPGVVLTSAGAADIYVIKLSSATGDVVWAKRFGGAMADNATSIAIGSSDEIYVAGSFRGTIDLGGGPKQVANNGTYILNLHANGDYGWDKTFEANQFYSVKVAARDDSAVLIGSFGGSMTAEGTVYGNAGSSSAFAIQMSASSGETTWVKVFGGGANSSVSAQDVAIDSEDNVVIVGNFTRAINFGGGPLSSPDYPDFDDVFLLKMSPNGTHLFSKRLGGGHFDYGAAISIGPSNGITIAGRYSYTADFGCSNLLGANPPSHNLDLFVAKYTQAGSCEWAKAFGLPSTYEQPYGISVNSVGEVVVTGSFESTITFGGQTLTSGGSSDVFFARFQGDGTHLSSVRAGGAAFDLGRDVIQSSDGRSFGTGSFSEFSEFGGVTLTAVGATDAFIVASAPL